MPHLFEVDASLISGLKYRFEGVWFIADKVQVVDELARYTPERETVLSIGVFDGVHLGHQRLLSRLVERASAAGRLSGVVTFSNHPKSVLSPDGRLGRLTTPGERSTLLRRLGVDIVVPLTFHEKLAHLTAREFVELLIRHLKMRGMVVGPDFALGRGREGHHAMLKLLGDELGFTVEVVEPVTQDGTIVSSTAVRRAISGGEMAATSRLLGRHFSLTGRVIGGTQRGHWLGYPTANLSVDEEQALPRDGVYATICHLGGRAYPSVTNIGSRPTFSEKGRTIEVFLIGFDEEIYGEEMTIELVERMRGVLKFDSPDELARQIGKDVEKAGPILQSALAGVTDNG